MNPQHATISEHLVHLDVRRDKIRCDGSRCVDVACSFPNKLIHSAKFRPCTSCLKKGYSSDQCIDGCEQCRRARVRCEAGKPCQRCREMQLECVEDTSPAISRQHPVLNISQPEHTKSQGSERAKLACKNCRKDNKKVRIQSCQLGRRAASCCVKPVSVMIRGHVPVACLVPKNVFMWDEVRNWSNCAAKAAVKTGNVVKKAGLVVSAWNSAKIASRHHEKVVDMVLELRR